MTEKRPNADTLAKLEQMLASGDLTIFSQQEVKELRGVIKVYRGLVALGWLGGTIRGLILVVATIVGAWAAVSGALADWIKQLASGG